MFDPCNPKVVSRFASLVPVAQQRHSLAEIPGSYGSDIYAVYYIGSLPRLCATSWQRPADLRGSSRADGEQCSHALGGRTAAPRTTLLHRESIAKAIETLNLVEFEQTHR